MIIPSKTMAVLFFFEVRHMGITVKDFLKETEIAGKLSLLSENDGLSNEIRGITIIEAPDVVRFIEEGEALLTGLYAFRTCIMSEFREYVQELKQKKVSALFIKTERVGEEDREKLNFLKRFAEKNRIPILEVPYDVSFQKIMGDVNEKIYNEEITLLKYDKMARDNFSAAVRDTEESETISLHILEMLGKMLNAVAALYDEDGILIASSGKMPEELELLKDAESCGMTVYTKQHYLRQQRAGKLEYLRRFRMTEGSARCLVIAGEQDVLTKLGCLAIENAVEALQSEFSRMYAIREVEERFQHDILYKLLHGDVMSVDELERSAYLLKLEQDKSYRAGVLELRDENGAVLPLEERMRRTEMLEKLVRKKIGKVLVQKDFDHLVILWKETEKNRDTVKDDVRKISILAGENVRISCGIGGTADTLDEVSKSCREAAQALKIGDILKMSYEKDGYRILFFSELGIFRFLCKLEGTKELQEYIPESLKKLLNCKKPQRDQWLETLRMYLKNGKNLSKTASELYIHYKTAAYRMEKITEITGIDFEDANEVLVVQIGLIILQMTEK